MAYCTQQDIEARMPADLVGFMSNDTDTAEIDTAKLSEAIEDAEALIDSYLRSRYTVPFSGNTPRLINRICIDLTLYFLWQRKFDEEMPDAMRARYTDSVKSLEAIQSGKINLPDVPQTEAVVPAIVRTNKDAGSRTFTTDLLRQW